MSDITGAKLKMINTRLAAASMALAIALVPLVAEAAPILGVGAFTCGGNG
jgi:hypothetical protein